jgi:hypothetical protein
MCPSASYVALVKESSSIFPDMSKHETDWQARLKPHFQSCESLVRRTILVFSITSSLEKEKRKKISSSGATGNCIEPVGQDGIAPQGPITLLNIFRVLLSSRDRANCSVSCRTLKLPNCDYWAPTNRTGRIKSTICVWVASSPS